MMGFHIVELWQNEAFHCHNQTNIIILTHHGKNLSKLLYQLCCRGVNYVAIEMKFSVVCLSFLVTLYLVLMEGQTGNETVPTISNETTGAYGANIFASYTVAL
jgi:hypothetical protein